MLLTVPRKGSAGQHISRQCGDSSISSPIDDNPFIVSTRHVCITIKMVEIIIKWDHFIRIWHQVARFWTHFVRLWYQLVRLWAHFVRLWYQVVRLWAHFVRLWYQVVRLWYHFARL